MEGIFGIVIHDDLRSIAVEYRLLHAEDMNRAILFDVDGTLLDSVDLHAECWRLAFEHFGKTIPQKDIRTQIGKGGDHLLPVFLNPEEERAIGEELKRYRTDLWKREFMPRVKPFPHVRDLFEALKRGEHRLALASSSHGDELEYYKRLLQIEDLLEGQTSADDAEHSKPDPDIFHAALASVKAKPEDAVAVGDSPYDAEAAGKAGIATAGVLCGGFAEERLRGAGCFALFRDPGDLLGHMEQWVNGPKQT
jgi:HAD superfamily hydrolase (TIGR01509 family)